MKVEEYDPSNYPAALFLLKTAFGENKELEDTSEMTLRVIVRHPQDKETIIAHAAAYTRVMTHQATDFLGAIIGDVAVAPEFQGKGLMREMLYSLHQHLISQAVDHSFLFAYNTDIYISSGYQVLNLPIHYYDINDKRWNTYIYHGAMFHSFGTNQLCEVINIHGRTY